MNEFERLRRTAERMKQEYPPGTRIQLDHMEDPWAPVPPGTRGTVAYVDDIGQIGMKWDNGRTLSLVPGEDSFRKLTDKELAEEQNQNEMNGDGFDEDEGPVLSM
ncbi:MAG: DUF4314 domain-containing protein [Clostridia bacterium]|nr:DUF4314 domain-containing protein [Clostridia bacterium]